MSDTPTAWCLTPAVREKYESTERSRSSSQPNTETDSPYKTSPDTGNDMNIIISLMAQIGAGESTRLKKKMTGHSCVCQLTEQVFEVI